VTAGASFVVAESRLVVDEEDLARPGRGGVHAGLAEDGLQMLLHGVCGDHQIGRDLGSRRALQYQPGCVLLALGQP